MLFTRCRSWAIRYSNTSSLLFTPTPLYLVSIK
uniref:Uncharacterized protein n=3 Tax=unclassified bacterial viruses TaxID=12333 RepID=A0AB39C4Q2_9VIRU